MRLRYSSTYCSIVSTKYSQRRAKINVLLLVAGCWLNAVDKKQVFGLNSQPNYSVNVKWQNTPEQRTEMLTYDKIDGFNQC